MLAKAKNDHANIKTTFYNEFTTRKKIWDTFTKFHEKNVLCEKGDEITRFDGTEYASYSYFFLASECNSTSGDGSKYRYPVL
jgi:hypothetical protein